MANLELSLAGVVVLAPALPVSYRGDAALPDLTAEQRTALGELHLRKIDLADRVLVVNPGGYLGDAVTREIAYARAQGTPVTFTDPA